MGKRKRIGNKKIHFDEEVVTKDVAEKLMLESEMNLAINGETHPEPHRKKNNGDKQKKRKKSQKKKFTNMNGIQTNEGEKLNADHTVANAEIKPEKGIEINENVVNSDEKIKSKKAKKRKLKSENSVQTATAESNEVNENKVENQEKKTKRIKKNKLEDEEKTSEIKEKAFESTEDGKPSEGEAKATESKPKPLSIREQKRQKHVKLLNDKKSKVEIASQKKSLNYLSKWKHSRDDWKFEKLTQIWIQHNMYDTTKIEDTFWDIIVEYFSSSKGLIRKLVLDKALEIVNKEGGTEDEQEELAIKVKRARDIIQILQE